MNKNKYLQTVGVIGLGIMGGMMAEALCAAGYKVDRKSTRLNSSHT